MTVIQNASVCRGTQFIALVSVLLVVSAGCSPTGAIPSGPPAPASAAPTPTPTPSPAVPPAEADLEESLLAFVDPNVANPNQTVRVTLPRTTIMTGENFLSDLAWASARNDYGPVEIDQSVGTSAFNDGNKPLTIGGTSFTKGLGVHGESEVVYALNAQCTQLQATVGINDMKGSMALEARGSVRFQVWADGVQLHQTDVLTGNSAALPIQLNISGAQELKLVTKNDGDSSSATASNYDHANWANARVTCTAAPAPAWTFCANDPGICAFTGTRQVRYGANGQYVVRTLAATNGGALCNSTVFGADPAPGVAKRCEIDGSITPVVLPTINAFGATPAAITSGANSTLTWMTNNADALVIDNGIGTVTGVSHTVSPTQTTTYILSARNASGHVTRATTVTVSPLPPPEVVPLIASFGSSPATITAGSATNLTWSVTGATSMSIAPGFSSVSGNSQSVSPTQTTTYVLTATNGTGSVTRETTVTVTQPPQTTTWTRCQGGEGNTCYFDGTRDVRFRTVAGLNVVREFSLQANCIVGEGGFSVSPGPGEKYCEYGPVKVTNIDPPDHSGMGPYIDISKIPRGFAGHSELRLQPTTQVPGPGDDGAVRVPCVFSHMSFDDPLVYPGNPGAAHLHAFFGNTLTNAHSTAESIKTTGNSTCNGGIMNRSAYWVPALIDTRDGSPVLPTDSGIYYKTGFGNILPRDIQMLPSGLRIISGDARASGAQENSTWHCIGLTLTPIAPTPPGAVALCPAGTFLTLSILFPQCWDGRNLDSVDHKSHMSFKVNHLCPPTHPVPVSEITINVHYRITDETAARYWRLSSDMYDTSLPGGYSAHADWFEGWNEEIKAIWTERCNRAAVNCFSQLLGDGRMFY